MIYKKVIPNGERLGTNGEQSLTLGDKWRTVAYAWGQMANSRLRLGTNVAYYKWTIKIGTI
jgi:hypothetical protein